MLVFNAHIMKCADFADNLIVHGNDTGFKRTAELQIGLAVFQEQHIRRVAADVNDEHPKHVDYHAAFRNNGRIRLREHHDLIDHNAIRLISVNKFDNAVPFEIPGEFVLEYAVMLRRQSHCQLDLFNGAVPSGILKFLCNGKQRQNKITLVLRFVTHVAQALSAGRPVPPVIFQDFVRHRRLDGVLRQTGNKGMMRRFDGIVAVVDCNQHIRFLLYFNFGFSLSLHESVCVFTTGIRIAKQNKHEKGRSRNLALPFYYDCFFRKRYSQI